MEDLIISGVDLNQLRNAEYIQMNTDILSIVNVNNPVALSIKPFYDALAAKMLEIDPLYKIEQGSVLTADLETADMRRDKAINGILFNVNSFAYHFEPNKAAAAVLLQANFNNYGTGIAKQNYTAETTIITNMVGDWINKPELNNAVDQLALKEWLSELDAANKAFNTIFLQRNKEVAANPIEKLKEKRLEANDLYYKLRDKLLAFGSVNDFANPWAVTIKQWNTLLETYNQIIATRAANNDDETTPPTP